MPGGNLRKEAGILLSGRRSKDYPQVLRETPESGTCWADSAVWPRDVIMTVNARRLCAVDAEVDRHSGAPIEIPDRGSTGTGYLRLSPARSCDHAVEVVHRERTHGHGVIGCLNEFKLIVR